MPSHLARRLAQVILACLLMITQAASPAQQPGSAPGSVAQPPASATPHPLLPELIEFCQRAYSAPEAKIDPLPGWTREAAWYNCFECNATLLTRQSPKVAVLVFRGTNVGDLGDWGQNVQVCNKGIVPSMVAAQRIAEESKARYPDHKFVLTGHSKGGIEAAYAAAKIDEQAVVFGSPGLPLERLQRGQSSHGQPSMSVPSSIADAILWSPFGTRRRNVGQPISSEPRAAHEDWVAKYQMVNDSWTDQYLNRTISIRWNGDIMSVARALGFSVPKCSAILSRPGPDDASLDQIFEKFRTQLSIDATGSVSLSESELGIVQKAIEAHMDVRGLSRRLSDIDPSVMRSIYARLPSLDMVSRLNDAASQGKIRTQVDSENPANLGRDQQASVPPGLLGYWLSQDGTVLNIIGEPFNVIVRYAGEDQNWQRTLLREPVMRTEIEGVSGFMLKLKPNKLASEMSAWGKQLMREDPKPDPYQDVLICELSDEGKTLTTYAMVTRSEREAGILGGEAGTKKVTLGVFTLVGR